MGKRLKLWLINKILPENYIVIESHWLKYRVAKRNISLFPGEWERIKE